jgi:hypothetical protein
VWKTTVKGLDAIGGSCQKAVQGGFTLVTDRGMTFLRVVEILVEILIVPIIVLNASSLVIGGVWLGFYREWPLLLVGVFFLFTSDVTLGLFLMPTAMLGSIISAKYEKMRRFSLFLLTLTVHLYTNFLIVAWCALSFLFCSRFYAGSSILEYLPYALWSWPMALVPWQFLASGEDNEFTAITVFSASLFYLLFLVGILFFPVPPLTLALVFGGLQLIAIPFLNLFLVYKMEKEQKPENYSL